MVFKSLAIAASLTLAAGASATVFQWNWTSAQGAGAGGAISNAAGTFESIQASYNDVSKELVWNATFSDQQTRAYTLAINNGPNPKGKAGELALIYFDADLNPSTPRVSVFGYNGANAANSYLDGDGLVGGNQATVKVHKNATAAAEANDWLKVASMQDVGSKRIFSLTIDASVINGFVNPYSAQYNVPWTGAAFAEKLGLWFHTYKNIDTGYDGNGYLNKWTANTTGYFDGSNFSTLLAVPMPSAVGMGLVGLAAVGYIKRRRLA